MYEAHNKQRRITAMSGWPSAQQAKKQKAERLANAELIFAFAQLRGEGTQIDPHGPRRMPQMPKIINLGNCVKLLWFTTF